MRLVQRRWRWGRIGRIATVVIVAVLFFSPLYVSFTYSFKSRQEVAFAPLAFPTRFHLENYRVAIEQMKFLRTLFNSVIVTTGDVVLVLFVCSMASYVIARNFRRGYKLIYYLFISSIFLPFQVIMFPLYKQLYVIGFVNTFYGLILTLVAFGTGFFVFIYSGFVRTIPLELEESAQMDGCSVFRVYRQIIFPLMQPVNASVMVLAALGAWNEFIIPLIIAQRESVRTLPLTQYFFFGRYTAEIGVAFAGINLVMIPVIVFYLAMQKYIVRGVTAGALKG